MSGLRVLIAAPVAAVRGPLPKLVPLLAEGLRELGCEVGLAQWGRRRDRESLVEKSWGRWHDLLRIRAELRRRPWDLLLIKSAHDWPALARDLPLLLATRGLCHRILAFHGSQPQRLLAGGSGLFRAVTERVLREADACLVLSREEQELWQRFSPATRFRLMKDPYRPFGVAPTPERSQFGLPADEPVVLFVGRLIQGKGVWELLEAVRRVNAERPCRLLVLGDGELRDRLRERAAADGLADRVIFAGYVGPDELQAAYRCADVFVLPSWTEGFPMSIIEAMDCGLPIVTTPIRGMADHLVEGENALFVPVRGTAELAAALRRLLEDRDLRARMAANNRLKVGAFSPAVVAREHLEVFREFIGAGLKPS